MDDAALKAGLALVPEVYKDLLQPGVRQLGIALETVVGVLPAVLSPLEYVNKAAQLRMTRHIEHLRQKLEAVDAAHIIPVAPEVAIPVFERLRYTDDETLSALYIQLLVSAADTKTVGRAHPSFAQLIASLSPDEAALLQLFEDPDKTVRWPYLNMALGRRGRDESTPLRGPLLGWEVLVKLRFPDNLPAYVDNLARCGLLALSDPIWRSDLDETSSWDRRCIKLRAVYKDAFGQPIQSDTHFKYAYGSARLTEYGRLFITACVTPCPEVFTGENFEHTC